MTTLIIDYKEKSVSADNLVSTTTTRIHDTNLLGTLLSIEEGSTFLSDQYPDFKIKKIDDCIIAGVGKMDLIHRFIEEYTLSKLFTDIQGEEEATIYIIRERNEGLMVIKCEPVLLKKRFFIKDKFGWKTTSILKRSGYEVDGSGRMYARGALATGATPHEAIVAASLCDHGTGSTVLTECF